MTDEEKMDTVKAVLEETDDCRGLTDQQLNALLRQAGGDVRGTIYLGAMQKARMDGITLPDGTVLPNNRDYWLTIAACNRPNLGGCVPRADGR